MGERKVSKSSTIVEDRLDMGRIMDVYAQKSKEDSSRKMKRSGIQ